MSEFNRSPRESEKTREYKDPSAEYHTAEERKYYLEADKTDGNNTRPRKKKKADSNALTRILSLFVVTAAVAVGVMSSGALVKHGNAEIVNVSVTDTVVSYDVTAEGENLSVVLYNDFTKRETVLKQGENSGEFTKLKPGVSYTLAVVEPAAFGSERTLTEKKIKTDVLPPPAPVSVWYGIDYRCTCAEDGYFHFTMNFDDPNGYYSDFTAQLTDAIGNVSICEFTSDLHAEQRIDVTFSKGLWGKRATFTLTYKTSDPSADSQTVEYNFYDVKI